MTGDAGVGTECLRIRWPDDAPLPPPGTTVRLEPSAPGEPPREARVLFAPPTYDPAWIEVEVALGSSPGEPE